MQIPLECTCHNGAVQLGSRIKKTQLLTTMIMGDFNLDARMEHNLDYKQKALLEPLPNFALSKDLVQIIDFTTQSRIINGVLKQSLLDHVYVSNFAMIENVDFETPTFGDHLLIKIKIVQKMKEYKVKSIVKRSWSKYSVARLCHELNESEISTVSI